MTLPVDGSKDSEWKLKMIEKHAGECEITPQLVKRLKIVNAMHDVLGMTQQQTICEHLTAEMNLFIHDSDDGSEGIEVAEPEQKDVEVGGVNDPNDIKFVDEDSQIVDVWNGLHDLGKFCYINCVVQTFCVMRLLLNCIEDVQQLQFDSENANKMSLAQWMNEQLLCDKFLKVTSEINHSEDATINPKKFITAFPAPCNVIDIQREATEFYGRFIQLIDELCEASLSKPELIPTLLSFQIETVIKCGNCDQLS